MTTPWITNPRWRGGGKLAVSSMVYIEKQKLRESDCP